MLTPHAVIYYMLYIFYFYFSLWMRTAFYIYLFYKLVIIVQILPSNDTHSIYLH